MSLADQHVWITKIHENVVRLGLTSSMLAQIGKILHIDLPSVGAECKKGEMFAVIESSKSAIEIPSPISGTVIQVNETVLNNIQLLNESSESDGWLVIIKSDLS